MRRQLMAGCASVLLGGCVHERIEVKPVGVEPRGVVMGGVLETPPPLAVVTLRERDGQLEADARWDGVCARTERGVEHSVQLRETRINTTTIVFASIFAGSGAAVYMWPDLDAKSSLIGGSILLGIGALIYGPPKASESEQTEALPPREVERPLPPAACFIAPARNEPIVVTGSGSTLEGRTDASGYIRFETTLSPPVEITIRGRPAARVEWQK